ncbi:MAG: hypothetical protein ACI8P3_004295 [Saprospiraceae bacterium]|jgi:hypothetical protein
MKKNTLSPDLDLLCKTLCRKVLKVEEYQNLSTQDLNKLSSFLIRFNPEFSSSKESLNKNLQNWFLGKNAPSPGKIEEIAKSLGYTGYPDFIHQNKRKIQTNRFRQSISLNPFHKTLLYCGFALIIALLFPLLTGISVEEVPSHQYDGSKLLASAIQAVVVILFYLITRFSDFGGRDQIRNTTSNRLPEVSSSLNQFFAGWKYLWLSFSILYIWFCILYGTGIYSSTYAQSVSDIITIFSSLCFAYLFSVMDVESYTETNSPKKVNTFYSYLLIFTISLSVSSIMSILDRYYDLGFLDGTGTYLLGYANVIVMLYFFGRLESHYLNVNRFVLLPLYTYAIIQIAYVIFFEEAKSGEQSFEAYVIGMALILKGFLYFLIRDWIKDGKMENYFLKQRRKIED